MDLGMKVAHDTTHGEALTELGGLTTMREAKEPPHMLDLRSCCGGEG